MESSKACARASAGPVDKPSEKSRTIGIIAELLERKKWGWVDPRITDEHFPADSEPSLDGARLEQYDRLVSSQFILDDLERRGRRPANAAEMLAWIIANPDEQKEYSIVGLGKAWVDLESFKRVVVLPRLVSMPFVSLGYIASDWDTFYRFLSFPCKEGERLAA